MPTFLPSAPFIRIVGALVIVAGGIYGAYFFATHKTSGDVSSDGVEQTPVIIADNPLLKQVADLDSDKDGLRDWEEHLWKTSAMNKDTDGDGTSDSDEVSTNRNPTVKGPRDSMRETIDLEDNLTPESLADLTATERLSREFFVKYMSYKKGGKALTDDEEKALLQYTLLNSVNQEAPNKVFTINDIVVTQTSDTATYSEYGNGVGLSIISNTTEKENELVVLERALRTKNLQDVDTLKRIQKQYEGMLKDLRALPTPSTLTSAHLSIMQNVSDINEAIADMTLVDKDPIQTIVAVSNYQDYVKKFSKSIRTIQELLNNQGVEYSQSEPGYMFMNIGTGI